MVDVFPMISAVYVYIGETLLAQHRNALDQQTESTLRSLQLLGKQVVDTAIQDMKSPVVSGKPFMVSCCWVLHFACSFSIHGSLHA